MNIGKMVKLGAALTGILLFAIFQFAICQFAIVDLPYDKRARALLAQQG